MSRRCIQFHDQPVEFNDVGVGDRFGPLWTVVAHTDDDDPALAIFRYFSVLLELASRTLHLPDAVDGFEIELLDNSILYRFAAQNSDEEGSGSLQAQEVAGQQAQTAAAPGGHGHQRGQAGTHLAVRWHQLSTRLITNRDEIREQYRCRKAVRRNPQQEETMIKQEAKPADRGVTLEVAVTIDPRGISEYGRAVHSLVGAYANRSTGHGET